MPATTPTRVLVDARLGWGSGIGRYIENMVPRVARLSPEVRFDLLVTHQHADRAREVMGQSHNVAVIATAIQPFSVAEQYRLAPLARGYDLTWFTNYWTPWRWPGRFVATVYDLIHLRPDIFPASPLKRWVSRRAFARVGRKAKATFFISRFTRDEFERIVGRPRRGVVTHLGIDHVGWEATDAPSPTKAKRLLVVAASKAHKNFSTVLDAWARAQVARHWTLTVITPNEKLRSFVDVHSLAERSRNVDVRQGVSDAELRTLYAEAMILLAPSLYEGFGFPLLEGLRAGAFGISSTAGSLVEIAEGADVALVNGLDVDGWVTAIERACARFDEPGFDPAPIVSRNMAHAGTFCWEYTARATADALRAALDDATPSE